MAVPGRRTWKTSSRTMSDQLLGRTVRGAHPARGVSHLEHVLVEVCHWIAGHQVGIALAVRLPGDGSLSLSLLRN